MLKARIIMLILCVIRGYIVGKYGRKRMTKIEEPSWVIIGCAIIVAIVYGVVTIL